MIRSYNTDQIVAGLLFALTLLVVIWIAHG